MYSDGFITRGVDSDSQQQQQNETPERRSASAGAVEHARHERDLSGHYMGIEFASQQPVFEAPPNTAQERAVDSQLLARAAAAPQGPFARGDFNSMEQPSLFMASSASAPPAFKSVAAMPGHSAPLDFSRPDLLMAKPSLGATSTMMMQQQQTKQFEIVTPAAPVAQIAQQMQSAASPPPQAPDFYEKSSSFQSEAEPAEILTSIYAALQSTQMVNGCEVDTEGWSISGWAQLHHQCASFCVFLYTLVTGKTLVEFQRRKGDTMTFVDLFQATVLRADAIRPKPIDAMHPLPVNAAAQAMREQAAARMSPSNQFGMGMPTLGGATSRVPLSRATSSPFEETVSIEGPLTETLIDMSLSDVFEPQREAIAAMARASEDASNSLALAQDKRILAALQAALQPSAFEIVAPAMVCLSNLCCSTMVGQDICQQLVENQDLTQRLFELLSTSVKSQRAIAASAARIALQLSQYQKDALKDFQQVMSNVADTTDDAAIRHDTSQALRNVLAH